MITIREDIKSYEVWVGETFVGSCLTTQGEDYTYLYQLYVEPKYRRKGYARQLVKSVMVATTGQINVISRPYLETTVSQEDLEKFYTSLGFESDGENKFKLVQ